MRVLIACEYSGVVRQAFRERGHDAWSCDLLPSEDASEHHIIGNVLPILADNWDLMIAHPPCTHLSVSGARWFKEKQVEQAAAIRFFSAIADAPIPRMCLENPVSVISTRLGPPTQIIQPWQFGHAEMKSTCLWLHWLPPLMPTNVVGPPPPSGTDERKKWERVWRMPPRGWSGDSTRWKERSRTYQGIATAMAEQWG